MRRCQPVPRLWLMTDERMGEALWDALRRLPRGSGVVFRHYRTPLPGRRVLWRRVVRLCRARGLVPLRAGVDSLGFGEVGAHGAAPRRRPGLRTAPVHDARELRVARAAEADAVFVSPIRATRSHPGAKPMSTVQATLLVRHAPHAIALGGVGPRDLVRLRRLGFYGVAGIDAWTAPGRQKRKAVPI